MVISTKTHTEEEGLTLSSVYSLELLSHFGKQANKSKGGVLTEAQCNYHWSSSKSVFVLEINQAHHCSTVWYKTLDACQNDLYNRF